MKRRFLALAAVMSLAYLGVGTLLRASEEPEPNEGSDPTIQQLLDRIEKLEARVEQLERRQPTVAVPYTQPGYFAPSAAPEWPQRPGQPEVPRATPAPLRPYPPGQPVPKGWRLREFNGMYYYIVPCDALPPQTPSARPAP